MYSYCIYVHLFRYVRLLFSVLAQSMHPALMSRLNRVRPSSRTWVHAPCKDDDDKKEISKPGDVDIPLLNSPYNRYHKSVQQAPER
jgi:hypothetical protein